MGRPKEPPRLELKRVLRLWDSVAVTVGIIIGSGIFFSPTSIARDIPYPGLIVLVWILGGIAALCGALTYAELGSIWPHTGGIYVFIRECFGPLWSFIYGWAQLIIIRPAGNAAVAVICAQYLAYFYPVPQTGIKLLAISAILAVSIINYVGVRLTSQVQNVLTVVKILALLVIAFVSFLYVRPEGRTQWDFGFAHLDISLLSALGLALIGVFWTYDGWSEITFVAGEVKEPEKTIPRSLLISGLAVLVLYLLVNLAYLHVLDISEIQRSERVAADAMIRVLGKVGGTLISLTVIISTLGSLNGTTLTGARLYFAMAVDGLFFPWAKKIDPKFKTPSTAIAIQALLAVPLVITWTFDQLATYYVFVSLIFYSLVALAVFKVRKMKLSSPAHYKTWGYPVTPIFFLLVAFGILGNTLWRAPEQAIVGSILLAIGVPIYFYWKPRGGKPSLESG